VLDSAAKNSEAEKNPSLKQENAFSNWGGNKYGLAVSSRYSIRTPVYSLQVEMSVELVQTDSK
jgi:hypothetical protein